MISGSRARGNWSERHPDISYIARPLKVNRYPKIILRQKL